MHFFPSFVAGAFIPAVPVQPVVIRYPNKLVRSLMTTLLVQHICKREGNDRPIVVYLFQYQTDQILFPSLNVRLIIHMFSCDHIRCISMKRSCSTCAFLPSGGIALCVYL